MEGINEETTPLLTEHKPLIENVRRPAVSEQFLSDYNSVLSVHSISEVIYRTAVGID